MKTTVCAALTLIVASLSPAEEPVQEPRARLQISGEDVLTTRTVDLGERRVTFEKIRPLSLPAIPKVAPAEPDSETIARFRELAAAAKAQRYVFVSGTVYLREDDPKGAKSLVSVWSSHQREPFTMWVNANMLYLGGVADFETDDADYSLMLMMSSVRMDQRNHATRQAGLGALDIQMPDFKADDTGEIRVVEGEPSVEEIEPIRSLMAFYLRERVRLEAAHNRRLATAEARRLERLANPPEKKDIRVRYWRLDQPAEMRALIR